MECTNPCLHDTMNRTIRNIRRYRWEIKGYSGKFRCYGTHYIMVHIIMEKEYTCSQVIMKRQIEK